VKIKHTPGSESVNPAVWAEVSLDALSHNINVIKHLLSQGSLLAGVVKKNAYGHGLIPVARHLESIGIDWLAVYSLSEGLELRRAGVRIPVLVFGFIPPEEAELVTGSKLTPTVMTSELAQALNSAAGALDIKQNVHVKVDTGLNRSGMGLNESPEFLSFLSTLTHIEVEGLYTHFSSADEKDPAPTETQLKRLLELANRVQRITILHAANSAATLRFQATHLNMVRVGISMYGLSPSQYLDQSLSLRPALSLKSRIARIHRLKPGDGVGYGLTWKAKRDSTVALVPAGYGDGLPKLLSNRGEALVRGFRVPIRGIVSMDQIVLDVSDIPEAHVGDTVTFIGKEAENEITADKVAGWATTINYEIVTRLPSHLPRFYI
jgi:alanine racemase